MKYTKLTVNIILENIAKGLNQKDAGILAGVSDDTICAWKKKYSDFSDKIAQKEIIFKQDNIDIIQKAADSGTWQAAAWFLERKYSDEFATKNNLDLTTGGKPFDTTNAREKLIGKLSNEIANEKDKSSDK